MRLMRFDGRLRRSYFFYRRKTCFYITYQCAALGFTSMGGNWAPRFYHSET